MSSRPSTGRSPITSKYEPFTTAAVTLRGSLPGLVVVNPTAEKSPKALIVLARALKSSISGTENVMFSMPAPGAR